MSIRVPGMFSRNVLGNTLVPIREAGTAKMRKDVEKIINLHFKKNLLSVFKLAEKTLGAHKFDQLTHTNQ